jgi:uncharacterized protein (TIGR00369 family)
VSDTSSFPIETAGDAMPYTRLVGIEFLSATTDEVRARLAWSPERCTSGGAMHGGAFLSLADSAGGLLAFLNLPEGATGTSTVSSTSNFLRGLTKGHVNAVTIPLHRGRTTIVVVSDLSDDDGRLLARVTQTQAVLRG